MKFETAPEVQNMHSFYHSFTQKFQGISLT